MHSTRYRTQDGQPLSRHLQTVPAEKVRWIRPGFLGHDHTMSPKLDRVKGWARDFWLRGGPILLASDTTSEQRDSTKFCRSPRSRSQDERTQNLATPGKLPLEQVKGFLFGLILLPALVGILLSARPGGIHRQLQLVARRLRLALTMAGAFMVGSVFLRLLTRGPVTDFAQPVLAVVLAGTFVFMSQDPTAQPGPSKPRGPR